jgi:hypothetical protein
MRCPGHCSGQVVDSGGRDPGVVESTAPVAAGESVFDAGEAGEPQIDVVVDVVELAGLVASTKVVPPPSEDGFEAIHDGFDVDADQASVRALTDLGQDRVQGPIRRPPLQIPSARATSRRPPWDG